MSCCSDPHCEWWIGNDGENYLKGDYVNCDNPCRLPDDSIVDILRSIPEALESFYRLLGSMEPDEQARLRELLHGITLTPVESPKDEEDRFQNRWNTQGIHTAGPYGGTGCG